MVKAEDMSEFMHGNALKHSVAVSSDRNLEAREVLPSWRSIAVDGRARGAVAVLTESVARPRRRCPTPDSTTVERSVEVDGHPYVDRILARRVVVEIDVRGSGPRLV